jgi:hypothetical protein
MLALVTDSFGGRGGMAQYNRDFFGALVEVEAVSSILVLPRYAPDPVAPGRINQAQPRLAGRVIPLQRSRRRSGTPSTSSSVAIFTWPRWPG